jgi:hypothetical protein
MSILEREYHIDLGDMRKECRAYFESHLPVEEENGIIVTAAQENSPAKKKLSRFFLLFILVILGFGSWFVFVEENESLGSGKTATGQESFYDSVVSMAGTFFKSSRKESTEGNTTGVPVVEGAWAEKKEGGNQSIPDLSSGEEKRDQAPPETGSVPKVARSEESGATVFESKKVSDEKEEERIIEQVKKEQAQAEKIRKESDEDNFSGESGKEENVSDISKMIFAATVGAAEEEEKEDAQSLETAVPSMTDMKNAQPARQEGEASGGTTAVSSAVDEKPKAKGKTIVVFHPRSKIWVGYTNLRNMKREAKIASSDISFDTGSAEYILATGHGKIEFRTSSGVKKYNDGQKHFFMISKGGIREMSHEAFQRLNKSKVW